MEPTPPQETPTPRVDSPLASAPKSYAAPKLIKHGKLPPLTLGPSVTDQ